MLGVKPRRAFCRQSFLATTVVIRRWEGESDKGFAPTGSSDRFSWPTCGTAIARRRADLAPAAAPRAPGSALGHPVASGRVLLWLSVRAPQLQLIVRPRCRLTALWRGDWPGIRGLRWPRARPRLQPTRRQPVEGPSHSPELSQPAACIPPSPDF